MMQVGVDLMEFKRAGSFYRTHKERLGSFFAPRELSYIRKSRRPRESLALLLAAKEAVFKSLGIPWMGLEGFRDIRIRPGRRLSCELTGSFAQSRTNRRVLSFRKYRHFIVVGCGPVGLCAGT
jgi:phosphopantetheine--protein transferase-like protein